MEIRALGISQSAHRTTERDPDRELENDGAAPELEPVGENLRTADRIRPAPWCLPTLRHRFSSYRDRLWPAPEASGWCRARVPQRVNAGCFGSPVPPHTGSTRPAELESASPFPPPPGSSPRSIRRRV